MDWSETIASAAIAFASAGVGAWGGARIGAAYSRADAREGEQHAALIRLHEAFIDGEFPSDPYALLHDVRAMDRLRHFASRSNYEPVRRMIADLLREQMRLRARSGGLPDPESPEWGGMQRMMVDIENLVSDEVHWRLMTSDCEVPGRWRRLFPKPHRRSPHAELQ